MPPSVSANKTTANSLFFIAPPQCVSDPELLHAFELERCSILNSRDDLLQSRQSVAQFALVGSLETFDGSEMVRVTILGRAMGWLIMKRSECRLTSAPLPGGGNLQDPGGSELTGIGLLTNPAAF
jgi:hypothetical protein